jgi:hypothetical protein
MTQAAEFNSERRRKLWDRKRTLKPALCSFIFLTFLSSVLWPGPHMYTGTLGGTLQRSFHENNMEVLYTDNF